eukprot:TRINITY_DN866_c0_g1_i1.p1 TRINITY_DN866_c0_g1~~TRINITY_DN866_c0_g1_i1.p1  ORF type:complete len:120 (-),score=28.57 TRINITY_DN866_c0_g1_i1:71-430(-)
MEKEKLLLVNERGEDITNEWTFPSSPQETRKYEIYSDLWLKGYFISSGMKFGADYLVYPGDPNLFHATFIVRVVDANEEIPCVDIVRFCRLAVNVKKQPVLASLSSHPSYCLLSWEGIS